MHFVLKILYIIHNAGFDKFLEGFLNLEYANYSVSFEGFDPKTGTYSKIVKIKGTKKQYVNNAARYVRKSLASLGKYDEKENRKLSEWNNKEIDIKIEKMLDFLSSNNSSEAKATLLDILRELAVIADKDFMSLSTTHK
mgnify:CR=1 FL=1